MININYTAEKTIAEFHADNSFVRGIRGPVGSGKSVGCCFEILQRAWLQKVHNGERRSRWAVIRQTYGELKTTTIQTWLDWFGDCTKIVYGHPIKAIFTPPSISGKNLKETDGKKYNSFAKVIVEIYFIAMDRPQSARKLKSLELTGAWINEVCEVPEEVLKMLTGRVGRYPSKRNGGFNWSGIIMDTNSCDVDNWYYKLAEEKKPDDYKFFNQPPALLENADGKYIENPEAENIENHTLGFKYYFNMLAGKPKKWVDVFICNKYGSHNEGNYVYNGYSQDINNGNHTDREFNPRLKHIIWAHDFNFTPLSSIIIQNEKDNIYCVDEIVLKSATSKDAAFEFISRYEKYKNEIVVEIYGDASGHAGEKHGIMSDYITLEKLLSQAGFSVRMKAPRSNPAIKSGQMSVQAKIIDALGNRSLFVNPTKCKTLDLGLAKLELKDGSTFLEKDTEYQHITTALRYYCAVEYPVQYEKMTEQRINDYANFNKSIGRRAAS